MMFYFLRPVFCAPSKIASSGQLKRPLCAGLLLLLASVVPASGQTVDSRWEPAIAEFEASDLKQPPASNGILFVGSSSIRKWDLDASFPEQMPINRGFGGSEIADSTQFASRIVIPHKPRLVVLYAGDNDIAHGKQACTVVNDFQQFVHTISAALPETKIAFLAIKPSIKRWELWPAMKQANEAIQGICDKDPMLNFIDIVPDMLNDKAMPDPELFADDGLHLSDQGYARWSDRVRRTLGW